jgi:hypothetical protein
MEAGVSVVATESVDTDETGCVLAPATSLLLPTTQEIRAGNPLGPRRNPCFAGPERSGEGGVWFHLMVD